MLASSIGLSFGYTNVMTMGASIAAALGGAPFVTVPRGFIGELLPARAALEAGGEPLGAGTARGSVIGGSPGLAPRPASPAERPPGSPPGSPPGGPLAKKLPTPARLDVSPR